MLGPWGYQGTLYSKICSEIEFECKPQWMLGLNSFYFSYYKTIQKFTLPKSVVLSMNNREYYYLILGTDFNLKLLKI